MRHGWRGVVAATLVAGALGVPPAGAQTPTQTGQPEPSGITLTPAPGSPHVSKSGTHFELGMVEPGAVTRGTLLARNLGDQTERATVYGADAIPARGGGFGFTTQRERPTDVGAWIKLDRTEITLAGKQTTTFGFQVVVPPGATAGEHIGGLVLQPVDPASGGTVEIGTRIAVGLYLTVAGGSAEPLRPSLTITKLVTPVRDGRVCPTVAYRNTGTAVLDPTAELRVDPKLPGATKRYPLGKAGGVPPGGSVEVDLPCVDRVPFGGSELDLTLSFPGGSAGRATDVTYWPFSIIAAGSLLLLVLLALLWLYLFLRRRDKREEEEASDGVTGQAAPTH